MICCQTAGKRQAFDVQRYLKKGQQVRRDGKQVVCSGGLKFLPGTVSPQDARGGKPVGFGSGNVLGPVADHQDRSGIHMTELLQEAGDDIGFFADGTVQIGGTEIIKVLIQIKVLQDLHRMVPGYKDAENAVKSGNE